MLRDILLFLVFLLVIASLLRDDFVFTLIYLMAGALFFSHWLSRKSLAGLQIERLYEARVSQGEKIPVSLLIRNEGKLPILWLKVAETTPIDLKVMSDLQQVISLSGKSHLRLSYQLEARKRGYFRIGPLQIASGDLLGIQKVELRDKKIDSLIVYPKVLILPRFRLSSRLPMGTLRDPRPIFEDPTRPAGKRDYISSDSIRRIDWKTSASVGRLQVKKFEPAIELHAAVFLNLNAEDYDLHSRFHDTELAITTAASMINWTNQQKQRFGFWTNGMDALDVDIPAGPIAVKKGRSHLMHIFETMARLKTAGDSNFVNYIHQQRVQLGWGATLVLITPQVTDELFDEIFQIQHAGHQVFLILCGQGTNYKEVLPRCTYSAIPLRQVRDERDLERMV